MKKNIMISLFVLGLGACVQAPDQDVLRQIEAIGPNSPPTEIITKRYLAISPKKVKVIFGFPDDCAHLDDVGLLTGWGGKAQSQQEIMQGFRIRAAKYGANVVVYEAGVSSLEEMDEILREPASYSLMRCR